MAFMKGLGHGEDNLRFMLYAADLSGDFTDEKSWGKICEFAVKQDVKQGGSDIFVEKYKMAALDVGGEECWRLVAADLSDNFIFSALAVNRIGFDRSIRVVPMAAFNRHAYAGLGDEFAVVRFLVWAGYDINAEEPKTKQTALHYFAFTRHLPGTNLRAVKWLIAHGANVNAANAKGDTPLTFAAGAEKWGAAQGATFAALIDAGADPFHPSHDGETPYSIMKANNARNEVPERTRQLLMLDQLKAEIQKIEIEADIR